MGYPFSSDTRAIANGRTFAAKVAGESDNFVGSDHSGTNAIAAAKAGQLTTRTDNDTGTLTMAGGHGITTGARLDVYWTNTDGTVGRHYGMTVGTVATNSVPIDGGAGDNLPALNAAITAMVPTAETITVTGDNAVAVAADSDTPATVIFAQSGGTTIKVVRLDGDAAYFWRDDSVDATPLGAANPLAGGAVGKVYMSHGDSAAAHPVRAAVHYN